jgi:hypothetical protein
VRVFNARVVQGVVVGLAILALVSGAVLLGASGSDRVDRAERLLARLYEQGDPAAVIDRFPPGTVPPEQRPQFEEALRRVLSGPFEVESSELFTVRGRQIARVTVAAPGGGPDLQWCVLPDDAVVLGCRLGTAQLEVASSPAAVEVPFAALDVFVDRVALTVVLTASGREEVALGDRPEVAAPGGGGEFRLSEASFVAGRQRQPAPAGRLRIPPGTGLLLVFERPGSERLAPSVDGPFELTWSGGSVRLESADVTWFIEGEAAA